MIAALLASYAVQRGFKLSRGLLLMFLLAGLFAAGGFGFWRGLIALERLEARAAEAATREAEARFKAEIAASNARVEQLRAEQALAAGKVSAEAEQEIAGLRARLAEMGKANATLPNGAAGGLDRARVRLLHNN